jgi:hypothetical protein
MRPPMSAFSPIELPRIEPSARVERVKDAEHVLWLLTSSESFDSLYTDRGLSTDRTVELLIDTAEQALYAKPYSS